MRTDSIRLFAEDGQRVLRHIPLADSNMMLRSGFACWHRKEGKLVGIRLVTAPKQSSRYRSSLHSSPCITHTQMLNNALGSTFGERKNGMDCYEHASEMIIGNAVDQAMSKVEAWPFIQDTRAPLASVQPQ